MQSKLKPEPADRTISILAVTGIEWSCSCGVRGRDATMAEATRASEDHVCNGASIAACCDKPLRFDPDMVGKTCGGLALRGWDVCDTCGAAYLVKGRSVPANGAGQWAIAKGGRSVDAGGIKVRPEKGNTKAVQRVMARISRVPELEGVLAETADLLGALVKTMLADPRLADQLDGILAAKSKRATDIIDRAIWTAMSIESDRDSEPEAEADDEAQDPTRG